MSSKRWSALKRLLWWIVVLLVLITGIGGYIAYKKIFSPNVTINQSQPFYLLIPTNASFDDVLNLLSSQNILVDKKSFAWTASRMKYTNAVKPGRYLIKPNASNKDLIALLRSGKQTPVDVVFNNVRTKQQLADIIGSQIEAPSSSILNLLNDDDYTNQLGFTSENILTLFIPDTYQLYWNTSADKFIRRMKKEYNKYWTNEKKEKAKACGLTPIQISVLASIVQQESTHDDEKNNIAGVYMNRINKNMKLEADPTLVYALGDFTINRILNAYKSIVSPYNTYMYAGLPPGPICLPTQASINAVLDYTHHTYYYFCAKYDFSGYHSFASTYSQHLVNAKRFQKELDRRGIRS